MLCHLKDELRRRINLSRQGEAVTEYLFSFIRALRLAKFAFVMRVVFKAFNSIQKYVVADN